MAPQSFFERHGPYSLAEVISMTGAEPGENADLAATVQDVAPYLDAQPGQITFLSDRKLLVSSATSNATACFVGVDLAGRIPDTVIPLVTPFAEASFARVMAAFYPDAAMSGTQPPSGVVSPDAFVDPTAALEDGVTVEPGAVIGASAEVGSGTIVCANAVVGARVTIGRRCLVGPGSTVIFALVGNNVIIHAGARIGDDGFGFAPGPRGFEKLVQIGRVIIQDDVEIGANATIDRGALRDTIIGQGTKIDNLVQIAHNVQIGRSCAFAGQSGLSGSTTVGDGVVMGGQAGTIPHVHIGSGAQIAAGTGITRKVEAGARIAGRPHKSFEGFLREMRAVARLTRSDG